MIENSIICRSDIVNWASIGDGLGSLTKGPRGPIKGGCRGCQGAKGGKSESPFRPPDKKPESKA